MAVSIRRQTRDGAELVAFMLDVLRGKVAGARTRDRIGAATWLADRGFGKPTPASEMSANVAMIGQAGPIVVRFGGPP